MGLGDLFEDVPNLHGVVFLDASEPCLFREAIIQHTQLDTYNTKTWPQHVRSTTELLDRYEALLDQDPNGVPPLHIVDLLRTSGPSGVHTSGLMQERECMEAEVGAIILRETLGSFDHVKANAAIDFHARIRRARCRITTKVLKRTADHLKQGKNLIGKWMRHSLIDPALAGIGQKLMSGNATDRLRGLQELGHVAQRLDSSSMPSEEYGKWVAAFAGMGAQRSREAITFTAIRPCCEALGALRAAVDADSADEAIEEEGEHSDDEQGVLVDAISGVLAALLVVIKHPAFRRSWAHSVPKEFFALIADSLAAGLSWQQDARFEHNPRHPIHAVLYYAMEVAIACLAKSQSELFSERFLQAHSAVVGVCEVAGPRRPPVVCSLLSVGTHLLRVTVDTLDNYEPDPTWDVIKPDDPDNYPPGMKMQRPDGHAGISIGRLFRELSHILTRYPEHGMLITNQQIEELIDLAGQCGSRCDRVASARSEEVISKFPASLLNVFEFCGVAILHCQPTAQQSLLAGIPKLVRVAAAALACKFYEATEEADCCDMAWTSGEVASGNSTVSS